jgi:hypothetical protein
MSKRTDDDDDEFLECKELSLDRRPENRRCLRDDDSSEFEITLRVMRGKASRLLGKEQERGG